MRPILTRWLLAATATGALVSVLAVPGSSGFEQVKADTGAKGEPVSTTVHCQQCHTLRSGPGYDAYEADGRTKFIRFGEFQTWKDEDLHSRALANIQPQPPSRPEDLGNLAWQMQTILSQSPSRKGVAEYRVNNADECLACHAVDKTPGSVTAGQMTPDRFHIDAGVGCEACHGLVTDAWIGQHIQKSWRDKAPAEKREAKQIDLRDPFERARTCAACHIGDKEHGKFVTHEMYAAGHPPLPPLEVVTFARDAPPHYHLYRENPALLELATSSKDIAWRNFHYRLPADKESTDRECPEARALALGSVATFRATMKLLETDAAQTPKGQLLDFAHFDCWACHHDLKVPSWRQERGFRGTPGRPTMKPWATEILRAVMDHAKVASGFKTEKATTAARQFQTALEALNKQFDVRPFGDPVEIAKQAKAFDGPLTSLLEVLNDDAAVYTPAQTKDLYERLKDRLLQGGGKPGPDGLYLDYDAAQQAIWALRVLRSSRDGWAPKSGQNLSDLEAALNAMIELHVRASKREPVAGDRLRTRLGQIAAFDPNAFLPKVREWANEK